MAVNIQKTVLKPYGNVVHIFNEYAELYVSLDYGPRVIRYNLIGGTSLFKEDPELTRRISGEDFDKMFYPGATWYNRGGSRLWAAPERMPETYYPDNEPVEYELVENGAIFMPPPQEHNNRQFAVTITMDEDSAKVWLQHEITNIGDEVQHYAPWVVTVMGEGGFVVVPQPKNDTGLVNNRTLSLWSYTDMCDPRLHFGSDFITLRQDPTATTRCKFGINNLEGWAAYINHNTAFIKYHEHFEGGNYPDGGVSFEGFTSPVLLEVETLAPLCDVFPGNTLCHEECWDIKALDKEPDCCNDGELADFAATYID